MITIELSLRKRANRARFFAILWLSVAIVILVGTYISLPSIAGKTLHSIAHTDGNITLTSEGKPFPSVHVFGLATMTLGIAAVAVACYLLGRSALMEFDSAERLRAIADALCICGSDFNQLEKATALLLPKSSYLPSSKLISTDDLKDLAEILKKIH